MQAVIPGMRQHGAGSIINTASERAHQGGAPNRAAAYFASKAAVLGARHAALSLAAGGIRVNSISPAVAATPQVGDPDAVHRRLIERIPMRRAAQPVEVSYLVLSLTSDEASYTTGQDHLIDGGLRAVQTPARRTHGTVSSAATGSNRLEVDGLDLGEELGGGLALLAAAGA